MVHERYQRPSSRYYIQSHVILILYEAFDRFTFENEKREYEIATELNNNAIKILVWINYKKSLKNNEDIKDIVSDEEVSNYLDDKNNFFFSIYHVLKSMKLELII